MASRIAQHFIDALLTRSDLVNLIDHYVPLKKAGKNYQARCPFHSEKTPSFTVSPDKQFYYCFGCGAQGNAISFLMNYAHLSYVEAIQDLAARQGVDVVYEAYDNADATTLPQAALKAAYELMQQAAKFYYQQLFQPHGRIAVDYFKRRGISGRIAKTFQLGFAPDNWNSLTQHFGDDMETQAALLQVGLLTENDSGRRYDRFRNRIMFPIHDRRGRVIAFGGRVLDDSKPKYLNSPETLLFQKSHELYAWHHVLQQRDLRQVIVVEGYMDVVSLAQHGVNHAVAALGTSTSSEHLLTLFQRVNDIVFCFDGDTAGLKAAWRALEHGLPQMAEGRQLRFAFLPEGEDPDSWVKQQGAAGLQQTIDQAQPLSDFLFDTLSKEFDLNQLEGKAALNQRLTPLLAKLPDGAYKQLMQQRAAQLTDVAISLPAQTLPQNFDKKRKTTISPNLPPPDNTFRTLPHTHRALLCLLRQPDLAQQLDYPNPQWTHLDLDGIDLLINTITVLKLNPTWTVDTLLAHWRDNDFGDLLQHLWQRVQNYAPDLTDEATELVAVIQHLEQAYTVWRKQFLLQKGQQTALNETEQQELLALIALQKRQAVKTNLD